MRRPLPFASWSRWITHCRETGLPYPEPEYDMPIEAEVEAMLTDSVCPATDGCEVEGDGVCPHGHPSWLLRLELI